MKTGLLSAGLAALLLHAGVAFAELDPLEKYDNFNTKKYNGCKYCIDPDKWIGLQRGDLQQGQHNTEVLREIKAKRLRMALRTWGDDDSDTGIIQGRNRVLFRDSEDMSGACFVPRINKYDIQNCGDNDSSGRAVIRYQGNFYDVDLNDDGDDGVIYAGIELRRMGNSPDKKKFAQVTAWAVQCGGSDCSTEPWSTYDDDGGGDDPDLDFGKTKWKKNKKAFCIGYDRTEHELVFSYGNDVRIVDASNGLPAFMDDADDETWHVIELRVDAENCTDDKKSSYIDATADDIEIRKFR